MAAFLLGAWLGGSLLMILIQVENLRFTAPSCRRLPIKPPQSSRTGRIEQNVAMLLRYQAAEQNRRYSYVWEEAQFGLGLILAACLFLGTQSAFSPMVFCGLMLIMVDV